MIEVDLSEAERDLAAFVGERRQARAEARGWRAQLGDGSSASRHVEGALGEIAVAKALGIYWTGVADLSRFDVGGYHVRTTRNPDGPLYIRPRENPEPDDRFVLVHLLDDSLAVIVGGQTASFVLGTETSDPGGRGCPTWIVPRSELRPISSVEFGRFVAKAAA